MNSESKRIRDIIDSISKSSDYFTIVTHILDLKICSDQYWSFLDKETKTMIVTQMVCYLEVERDVDIEDWTTQKYNELFNVGIK